VNKQPGVGKIGTQCKLCGNNAALVKSHILANALYPFDSDKNQKKKLMQVEYGNRDFEKVIQSGVWDKNILCECCESKSSSLIVGPYVFSLRRIGQVLKVLT